MSPRDKKLLWETEHRRYDFLRIWQKRYAHMKARHEGRATKHSHSEGKGIMDYDEFMQWCKTFDNLNIFLTIYFDWAANGFNRWDSPSVDRIDPTLGYIVGNIQWLPFSENCEKNHKHPITHEEVLV